MTTVRTHPAVCLVALALLIAFLAPATVEAQTEPGPFDPLTNHYKCYDIFESTPFEPLEVRLRDQFGLTRDKVLRPRLLCNPVSKNNEPIPHPEFHLVCYEILESADTPVFKVRVRNQFGEQTLKVQRPELLCLPSSKEEVSG